MKKIIQIVPAPIGWVSRFAMEDGTIEKYPVAVWAVFEENGTQGITGYSAARSPDDLIYPDDESPNFDGYEIDVVSATL